MGGFATNCGTGCEKWAAWRQGRTNLHTSQRAVHTAASVSLPDLGPWERGWEFPSLAALTNTLCEAATNENWTDFVRRVVLFVNHQTQLAVNSSAAESGRGWRQWAKEACFGSAGAGHASSKIGSTILGDPATCRSVVNDVPKHVRGETKGNRF